MRATLLSVAAPPYSPAYAAQSLRCFIWGREVGRLPHDRFVPGTNPSVFVYGFEKSGQDNIADDELREFRRLADTMLAYSDADISAAIKAGAVIEVNDA